MLSDNINNSKGIKRFAAAIGLATLNSAVAAACRAAFAHHFAYLLIFLSFKLIDALIPLGKLLLLNAAGKS